MVLASSSQLHFKLKDVTTTQLCTLFLNPYIQQRQHTLCSPTRVESEEGNVYDGPSAHVVMYSTGQP